MCGCLLPERFRCAHAQPPCEQLPKAMGFSEVSSRTMAIETSMKSSAFGFLLAKLHFGSFEARVPAAISVVWMAITGSMMAIVWRYIPVETPKFDRGVKDRFEKVTFEASLKLIRLVPGLV